MDMNFYRGKRVLVTGHTGFKGSWLCQILVNAGATVTGYSLPAPTQPSLFNLSKVETKITHVIGDVRDFNALKAVFDKAQPEIVLHLAAQPIVRESYKTPRETYETNV
ncbi:MAG: GDP-mannose 4,6-dehydratase, partial [Oscillospiraceae bacterium]